MTGTMGAVRRAAAAGAIAIAALGVCRASAQPDYPVRPVRVLVPFAAGGVVDVMARLLTQELSGALGESFYVDDVGGAGGNIGTARAAAAARDGYTLEITSSSFVINPGLHARVPYDPIADFTPVTVAATSPNVLVVNPGEPARTVADLVAAIARTPGGYSFASPGVGTTPHLSGELFRLSARIDLVHVPFAGAGPALQATVGGHTPMAFAGLPGAVPLIRAGSLRALAVTSPMRAAALPEVATMAEQGFAGQEAETLVFVLAPSGTPTAIVDRLADALRAILSRDDVGRQFGALGFVPLAMTPAQASRRLREELEKWAGVIAAAGLKTVE